MGLTSGNVARLCVGTGTVWRRDPVLEGNAGISELSAAISPALARETAPEAVGEASGPGPSQASRLQDGAPGLEGEW